jgi:transposase
MNILPIPLDITDVKVIQTQVFDKEIHIMVESTLMTTRCQHCGKQLTKPCGHDKERIFRHLSILEKPTFIHIHPLRFACSHCQGNPTTTQRLAWSDERSPQTRAYEDYLLLQRVNSTVSDVEIKEGIGYEAIMGIIDRRVAKQIDWKLIKRLDIIGVDEIALKKGHNDFVAIITGRNTDQTMILGVLENRDKATVKAFFSSIPKHLRKQVRVVCMDLCEGFKNAVREVFSKKVKVVADRFHVAKLYRKGVDDLRKKELARLKKELPEEEYKKLKGAMWALRKNKSHRNPEDIKILQTLFKHSPLLETAYYLTGILTHIFDKATSKRNARAQIQHWIYLVKNSELNCFDDFLKTLDKWMEEILNYFVNHDSSGFVEGINNKIKVMKRRCYGILNVKHLFQRIYLDLGNYHDFLKNAEST